MNEEKLEERFAKGFTLNLSKIEELEFLAHKLENHEENEFKKVIESKSICGLVNIIIYLTIRKHPEPLSDKLMSPIYSLGKEMIIDADDLRKIYLSENFLPKHFLARLISPIIEKWGKTGHLLGRINHYKDPKLWVPYRLLFALSKNKDIALEVLTRLQKYYEESDKKAENPVARLIQMRIDGKPVISDTVIKMWIDSKCDYNKLSHFKQYIPKNRFPWVLEDPSKEDDLRKMYYQFYSHTKRVSLYISNSWLFHLLCRHIQLHISGENTKILQTILPSLTIKQWNEIINGGVFFMETHSFGTLPNFLWNMFELKNGDNYLISDEKILELCENCLAGCILCITYIFPESRLRTLLLNLDVKYGMDTPFTEENATLRRIIEAISSRIQNPFTCDNTFELPYMVNKNFLLWTRPDGSPVFP